MVLRLKTLAVLGGAALALASCGNADETLGEEEPAREGLAIPLGGVEYNVFITRQLNPSVAPDDAYYQGPAPPADETLYGVFLQVCNQSDSEQGQPTEHFKIVDNQGNEFEPSELPEDNHFAYRARPLGPKECIPRSGSVAQLGPTAGSMLLFRLPLEVTENRPLELEIEGPFDALEAERETRTVELDI
jgi:hypothetical protein